MIVWRAKLEEMHNQKIVATLTTSNSVYETIHRCSKVGENYFKALSRWIEQRN